MLSLFIIESDVRLRDKIEKAIRNYILIEEINITIVMSTDNPFECLKYLEGKENLKGLYFLSLDLKSNVDGIVIGRRIRDLDPGGRIVIVSKEGILAPLTFSYKLEILDYIVVSTLNETIRKIIACVKVAYERYTKLKPREKNSLDIKIGSDICTFPLHQVCFIETSIREHHLLLYTLDNRIEFKGFIQEIKEKNPHLLETHRGVLVNLDNVKSFDETKRILEMENGQHCYVSIRKVSILKKKLAHF